MYSKYNKIQINMPQSSIYSHFKLNESWNGFDEMENRTSILTVFELVVPDLY